MKIKVLAKDIEKGPFVAVNPRTGKPLDNVLGIWIYKGSDGKSHAEVCFHTTDVEFVEVKDEVSNGN